MKKDKKNEYCGNCEWLSITEEEQNKQKIKNSHFCKKYKRRVYHLEHHPNIIKFYKCKLNK